MVISKVVLVSADQKSKGVSSTVIEQVVNSKNKPIVTVVIILCTI